MFAGFGQGVSEAEVRGNPDRYALLSATTVPNLLFYTVAYDADHLQTTPLVIRVSVPLFVAAVL